MSEVIKYYNSSLLSANLEKYPLGLFDGKMGICIYLYHQGRIFNDKKITKRADLLLEEIFKNVHKLKCINLDSGTLGIGLGIDYLLQESFVSGNSSYILKEFEDKIYQLIAFDFLDDGPSQQNQVSNTDLVFALFYITNKLRKNNLKKDEKSIWEDVMIKAINKIHSQKIVSNFKVEPNIFSLVSYLLPHYLSILSEIYKLGFFNYKLDKLFEELTRLVTITIPLLHSHRLLLYKSIGDVLKVKHIHEWENHYILLRKQIDFNYMITNEFRDRSISPINGVPGVYQLTRKTDLFNGIDRLLFLKKITQSSVWGDYINSLEKLQDRFALIYGLSGVVLTCQKIYNDIDNED